MHSSLCLISHAMLQFLLLFPCVNYQALMSFRVFTHAGFIKKCKHNTLKFALLLDLCSSTVSTIVLYYIRVIHACIMVEHPSTQVLPLHLQSQTTYTCIQYLDQAIYLVTTILIWYCLIIAQFQWDICVEIKCHVNDCCDNKRV